LDLARQGVAQGPAAEGQRADFEPALDKRDMLIKGITPRDLISFQIHHESRSNPRVEMSLPRDIDVNKMLLFYLQGIRAASSGFHVLAPVSPRNEMPCLTPRICLADREPANGFVPVIKQAAWLARS
jgi:hypothetical protein